MNQRWLCLTASAVAALALSIFAAANSAQNTAGANQSATAPSNQSAAPSDQTAQTFPAWAYPSAPQGAGRGAGGNGRGRGPGGQPGAPGGQQAGQPGGPGGQPGGSTQPPPDAPVQHVPGSSAAYTAAQVRNQYDIPDWFPDAHPAMPDMVSHGDRTNNAGGCGYCHLPNGFGRTENQSLAGLTADYIIRQVADFKSGARKTSGPRVGPVNSMVREAQNATDDDVKIGAAYFASVKPKPWIRVVETDKVPVTTVAGGVWVPAKDGSTEALGDDRIVEVAEDQDRFELRDASSGFIAYVPKGSIEKGKQLVMTGGGKTTPCTICHGEDLKGLGNIPYLAGRSPSQLARQIIDIQVGNRNGVDAALMKPVVKNLTNKDIVEITAYLTSLTP